MGVAEASGPVRHRAPSGGLFTRMREATGTVYGDIGTSVLYTVMEITRETVKLKHGVGDVVIANGREVTFDALAATRNALTGCTQVVP